MGFSGDTSEEPACQCWRCKRRKRHEFDPWVGKIPGGGHSNPLQYSYLENGIQRSLVGYSPGRGVPKSWIQLSMRTYQHLMEAGDVKTGTLPREKQLLKLTLCSLVL